MTIKHSLNFIAAALVLAGSTASLQAATVTTPYDTRVNGTGTFYRAKVTMTANDSWSTPLTGSAAPGAWSYANLNVAANPEAGWGHTSRWYLLELTSAADVTISMTLGDVSRAADARPGFVIYGGEAINNTWGDAHTYSNSGVNAASMNDWDGDSLPFTGNAYAGSTSNLSQTFSLAAGSYTVLFGNAADSAAVPSAVPYDIGFAAVPEPSLTLLTALGAGLCLVRRRRA